MTALSRKERLKVLELVAEIAGEASHNTSVVWMIEFQEELVEKLYRKMVALLEEPGATAPVDEVADTEREEESSARREASGTARSVRPRKLAKPRKTTKNTAR